MIHHDNACNTNNTDIGYVAARQDTVTPHLRPTEPLTYRLNLCSCSLLDYGQQRSGLYSSICIECVQPRIDQERTSSKRAGA